MTKGLISFDKVVSLVNIPTSTLRKKIKDREFPSPVKTGKRSIGFLLSDIDAWICSLNAER